MSDQSHVSGWPRREAELEMLRSRVEGMLEDRYSLLLLIGQDGPELCFRARSRRDDSEGILVALLLDSRALEVAARRLEEWVHSMAQVDHRTIPPVVDWGIGHGLLYYVVQSSAPITLEYQMADAERHPDFVQSIQILRDVADGLDYLHGLHLRHGNLKPSSILVSEPGDAAEIIGTGLRDALRRDSGSDHYATSSPAYAAPELWSDDPSRANGRSDQYALAVIAYELMTGRRRAAYDAVSGVITVEPIHIPLGVPLRPDLPLHVSSALSRAFLPRASLRFDSASDFIAALSGENATPAGETTEHPGLERAAPPQTAAFISIIALVFTLIITVILIMIPSEREAAAGGVRAAGAAVKTFAAGTGIIKRPTGTSAASDANTAGRAPGLEIRLPHARAGSDHGETNRSEPGGRPISARAVSGGGAAVTQMGFVGVSTDVGVGTVYIGDRMVGRTPLVTRLRTGEHVVSLRSADFEYAPASAAVTIMPGDTVRLRFSARSSRQ